MAYVADDFAYIAKRLKEIRGGAEFPGRAKPRDSDASPRLYRSGGLADDLRNATSANRGGFQLQRITPR